MNKQWTVFNKSSALLTGLSSDALNGIISSSLFARELLVSSGGSTTLHLRVYARVSELSVVRAVPLLHIHVPPLPSFHLALSFPPSLSFLLSPVHLSPPDSSHYCLGTSSACPAKARHCNGVWERGSVWEIVNEEREEDADRVRRVGGWKGRSAIERRKDTKDNNPETNMERREILQHH